MPRGDGPFQVIKRINDNAYELDMPDTYFGSKSFNITYLTHFSASFQNSWTNSLQPGECDENKKDSINRRNGQGPKHLKFFLLVFSKDEAQAQEAQAQAMRRKAKH